MCSHTLFYKIKHKDKMMLDMLIFNLKMCTLCPEKQKYESENHQ